MYIRGTREVRIHARAITRAYQDAYLLKRLVGLLLVPNQQPSEFLDRSREVTGLETDLSIIEFRLNAMRRVTSHILLDRSCVIIDTCEATASLRCIWS